jgi:hypothetical protein
MNKIIDISKPLIFQQKEIRRIWFEKQWYFSVVDIVGALTDSIDPKDYWFQMVKRERKYGIQLSTICRRFKLKAKDGKMRLTDVSNISDILRIIQSIPSKKAEPFKLWLAKVGKERLDEIQNPVLAMVRMKQLYKDKGYPQDWIEKRARGIAIRNELTDEWQDRGIKNSMEFAILTNEIMQGTFGMKVGDYKKFKSLKKENLRDHMDDMELIFTMLAEATTTRITRHKNSTGFPKLKKDASDGGQAVGQARKNIEDKIKEKVSIPKNYLKTKPTRPADISP